MIIQSDRSSRMSNRTSHLTVLQVPRRGAVVVAGDAAAAADPYDGPQPQTATCCTALQRGVALDGLAQPRYAPLRTLAIVDDDDDGDVEEDEDGNPKNSGKDKKDDHDAATAIKSDDSSRSGGKKKMVRKCKSTVDELKVSQLIQGPRLRRSVGMRRDWSFEDLGNAA